INDIQDVSLLGRQAIAGKPVVQLFLIARCNLLFALELFVVYKVVVVEVVELPLLVGGGVEAARELCLFAREQFVELAVHGNVSKQMAFRVVKEAATGDAAEFEAENEAPAESGIGSVTRRDYVALSSLGLAPNLLAAKVADDSAGAIASFIGTTRNAFLVDGVYKQVSHLVYSAYLPMAVAQIRNLITRMRIENPGIVSVAVAHRLGKVDIGEASIVVAVSSPHRKLAFNVCSELMDLIKESVPIWKEEVLVDNTKVWKENPESVKVWKSNS
ncbi:Molybdopterin synthase catalytic subunit, partial [Nowakowskiella sp. JEL0078]